MAKRHLTPDEEMGRLLEHRLQHTAAPAGEVCADAETLASYVDDGMSAAERAEWEAHFATCAKCRRALALMSRLKETASPVWEGEAARENPQGGNLWVWMPLAACILVGAGIYFATRPAEHGAQVAATDSSAAAPVIQEARSEPAPAPPASAPAGRVAETPAKPEANLDALRSAAPAPERPLKDARERKNGAAGDKADEAVTVTGQVPTIETSSTRRAPAAAPRTVESTTAAAAAEKSKAAPADQFAEAESFRRLQQPAPKPQQQMVSGPRESQSQQAPSQQVPSKQSQPQQAQASGALARSNESGAAGAASAGGPGNAGGASAGAAANASNVGNVNGVNAVNARSSGPTNVATNAANAAPPPPPAAAAVAAPAPATPPPAMAESVRAKERDDTAAAAKRTGAMFKVASADAKLEAERQGLLGTIADPALPARQWRIFKFGQIEVTRDNGGSWINEVLQTDTAYLAMASPAPGVGWIVGSKGTVWHLGLGGPAAGAAGVAAGAGERGRTEQKPSGTGAWQARSVPTQEDLVSVTATSARDAMVVTRSGLRFVTRDGGKSWTRQ